MKSFFFAQKLFVYSPMKAVMESRVWRSGFARLLTILTSGKGIFHTCSLIYKWGYAPDSGLVQLLCC